MEEQVANTVIAVGFGIGVVVWLLAMRCYRRMADAPLVEQLEARFSGKTPVEAIKAILDGAMPMLSMARLSRPAEDSLVINSLGVETRINAQRSGGQTLVTAEVDDAAMRRRMQVIMAILVVAVMPIVIAGVPVALWYFVAPNPTPGIRWQCVQVVQIVHVLWPPFVVYSVWKMRRSAAVAVISNLLVRAEVA